MRGVCKYGMGSGTRRPRIAALRRLDGTPAPLPRRAGAGSTAGGIVMARELSRTKARRA